MPQHRKRRREHDIHVMEDRPTITSATADLQGGSENHGSDSETQAMTNGPTTTSVTSTLQGGIQVGNNNNIIYRNCVITNNTNITHVTNKCERCHPAEEHDVSGDTPRDLIPSSAVHTTTSLRLVDIEGRELVLGDVVMAIRICGIYTDLCINVDSEGRELGLGDVVIADRSILWSMYPGDGMIIGMDRKTGKIVLEPINVEEPFYSFSPQIRKYSPIQIVQRAKGKVGQKYDNGPIDFMFWCCLDRTLEECSMHKGLQDQESYSILLRFQRSLMSDH